MEFVRNQNIFPSYERNPSSEASVVFTEARLPVSKITALHFHRLAEIGICLSGRGENYVGDRVYRFSEGDMQYIPAHVPHLSTADIGEPCVWAWISIDYEKMIAENFEQLSSAMASLRKQSFCGVFHPGEHPAFSALLQRLYRAVKEKDAFSPLSIAFLAGEILVESAKIGDIDGEAAPATVPTKRALLPAIEYIRRNYADSEALQEADIAERAGYSVSHFRRLFKEETGLTVSRFILKTRLSAAAYLLQTTEADILSVGYAAGFGDASNFYRAFRKSYGISPAKYRKQYKKDVYSLQT